MNPFNVGDEVSKADLTKTNGTVKYVACKEATQAGGKTCDKKNCPHVPSDYVWVKWGDGSTYSYLYNELISATEAKEAKEEIPAPSLCEKELVGFDLPKEPKKIEFDFDSYNGFNQVKMDRFGRQVAIKSAASENTKPPIKESDIDWDKYNGFRR